jgi:hypothetical protein
LSWCPLAMQVCSRHHPQPSAPRPTRCPASVYAAPLWEWVMLRAQRLFCCSVGDQGVCEAFFPSAPGLLKPLSGLSSYSPQEVEFRTSTSETAQTPSPLPSFPFLSFFTAHCLSPIWAMSPALFALYILEIGFCIYAQVSLNCDPPNLCLWTAKITGMSHCASISLFFWWYWELKLRLCILSIHSTTHP